MPQSRVGLLLRQEIAVRIEQKTEELTSGNCGDISAYRDLVGYIRGMNDALTLLEQIEEDFNK